tara:strand:- start:69 stop:521 length:453 start_codon:yes stop_codon:yes gene_type:complete
MLKKKIDQYTYENLLVEDAQKNTNLYMLSKFLKLRLFRDLILKTKEKKNFERELIYMKKILTLSKNISLKNNSNFYFVYLPELSRYKSNYSNLNYKKIKKITKELNINFINLVEDKEFTRKKSKFYAEENMNSHYNVKGYFRVAEILSQF